jgi:glutathione S-transferase
MLEEAEVAYDRVVVDVRDREAERPADFLAASPMGKVPALADGEVLMAESAAICLYVADRYAAGRLAPTVTDPERGTFLYWMFFAPAVIEPSMAEKAGGWTPQPGTHGWGSFDRMIETLENGLQRGPWLLGDQLTAADVMVGSSVVFMRLFKMLPASATLDAYADRCLERPGYQKAMALEG